MSERALTLGTAGHVDHGKTALVRALTGIDTDRLADEHERGISIELGYAALALPSGRRVSLIDVPGHERYVRTMVAGATGIDLYLMVIAADDGVMPQTREHAAVLAALNVTRGVVAITKSDLAAPGPATRAAAELLPGIEAITVSSRTGAGLDALRDAIDGLITALPARANSDALARLHVDRAFSIRGAGTVVTGTLWSGALARGDELTLLPGDRRVRVRGVHVHDEPVEHAGAGQRVAVNLTGVRLADVSRGDVLSADPALTETHRVDARLDASIETEGRVQVHHGTRSVPARLTWLGGRFHQVRLEQPLVAAAGDRLVIRQIAPPDTLGGGVVLDAHPRRHGPGRETTERLSRLARGDFAETVASVEPPPAPPRSAPPSLTASALATEDRLRAAGLQLLPDGAFDAADLAGLRAAGRAVRLVDGLHVHPETLAEAQRRVLALAGGPGGAVTVAQVRDELGSSRRLAVALLAHLDADRVTVRRGDLHVVRRRR